MTFKTQWILTIPVLLCKLSPCSGVRVGPCFCHTSPAKSLRPKWGLHFSQRELDFASAILDLIFTNLHSAFGAANPMVRRTFGFGAAKSAFKTNWILTVLFCGASATTKLKFPAPESHSFLTSRFFHVVGGCRFSIEICMCQF